MCGIYAIIPSHNKCGKQLRNLAYLLAEFNDSRGGQSYGMWTKKDVMKRMGQFWDEPNRKANRMFIGNWQPNTNNWLAGHSRWATQGALIVENQHPFTSGEYTLAHNGMVDVEGYTVTDHAVDSGRIVQAIDKHGVVDGLAKVSGSCGLLVSKGEHLFTFRGNQDLSLAQGRWGIAISSDKEHLVSALSRVGLTPQQVTEIPESKYINLITGEIIDAEVQQSIYATSRYGINSTSSSYGRSYVHDYPYENYNDYRTSYPYSVDKDYSDVVDTEICECCQTEMGIKHVGYYKHLNEYICDNCAEYVVGSHWQSVKAEVTYDV